MVMCSSAVMQPSIFSHLSHFCTRSWQLLPEVGSRDAELLLKIFFLVSSFSIFK